MRNAQPVPQESRNDVPDGRETMSFVLAFMQAYVIFVYFQAGLSKLVYGGIEWIATGRTVTAYALRFKPFLGQLLVEQPWMAVLQPRD